VDGVGACVRGICCLASRAPKRSRRALLHVTPELFLITVALLYISISLFFYILRRRGRLRRWLPCRVVTADNGSV